MNCPANKVNVFEVTNCEIDVTWLPNFDTDLSYHGLRLQKFILIFINFSRSNSKYTVQKTLSVKYEKVSIKSWISRLLAKISNSILVKTVKIHVKGAFFDCNFKSWQDMFDLSPPGMPKDLGPLIGALDQGTSCTRFLVFVASSGELVRNLNRTNNTYYYG